MSDSKSVEPRDSAKVVKRLRTLFDLGGVFKRANTMEETLQLWITKLARLAFCGKARSPRTAMSLILATAFNRLASHSFRDEVVRF